MSKLVRKCKTCPTKMSARIVVTGLVSTSPKRRVLRQHTPRRMDTSRIAVAKLDACWKRNEERRGEKQHANPPPGVIDTRTSKKTQMKRSCTAPSSRRRPQIEAVINYASAEWNRTTAIAPYRALRWSPTTVLLSISPVLAPGWRSVRDKTMSQ